MSITRAELINTHAVSPALISIWSPHCCRYAGEGVVAAVPRRPDGTSFDR
jgi:hypothetical protein